MAQGGWRLRPGGKRQLLRALALVCGLGLLVAATPGAGWARAAGGEEAGSVGIGSGLSLAYAIPFVGILLSIALFPLAAPHFWHDNFGKVSAFWAFLFAIPFLIAYRGTGLHEILEIYLVDYVPFIILLWALYTISGGILVRGSIPGTPLGNFLLLLVGALIASWIGTTGASMLMIRPVLKANAARRHKVHIICFFIFLVSNIGGSLTPLGDPPLFLGFLHGVPFFWTLGLFPHMILVSLALLGIFLVIDSILYRREEETVRTRPSETEPIRVSGAHNVLFLGGVIALILLSGIWKPGGFSIYGVAIPFQNVVRDAGMIIMGLLALASTRKELRRENKFSWFPIKEVAILFAGIFMTIIPALAMLRAGSEGPLAGMLALVRDPRHYFWSTGLLSSFLDNAPTYLTFFQSALASFHPGMPEPEAVAQLIRDYPEYLQAVSMGAVYMGANTYLGNAPNFMVKSIAEEEGIPMPSFLGYIVRYSIPILFPIFFLVSWISF